MKWYEEVYSKGKRKGQLKYQTLISKIGIEKAKNLNKLTISDIKSIENFELQRFKKAELKIIGDKIVNWAKNRITEYQENTQYKLISDTQAFAQRRDLDDIKNLKILKDMTYNELYNKVSRAHHILKLKTSTLGGFEEVVENFKQRIINKSREILSEEEFKQLDKNLNKIQYQEYWKLYNRVTENVDTNKYNSEQVQAIVYKSYKKGMTANAIIKNIQNELDYVYEQEHEDEALEEKEIDEELLSPHRSKRRGK